MKKIIMIIFMCMLMVSVSIAYTLHFDNLKVGTNTSTEAGTKVTIGLSDESAADFIVKSNNVELDKPNALVENWRDFFMPKDNVEITILSSNKTYDISAYASQGVTITPSGKTSVTHGDEKVYTIEATEGYQISEVIVDGNSFNKFKNVENFSSDGNLLKYTFKNVDKAHSIYVIANKEYTISFEPNQGEGDIASRTVVYKQPYGQLPNLKREGYHFGGWHLDAKFTQRVNATSLVMIPADHRLYAQWLSKEPKIFEYIGDEECFEVPVDGIYLLEVLGAGGGSGNGVSGGAGGYSSGYKILKRGEKIFVAVGGTGIWNEGGSKAGGYNGGGAGKGDGAGGGGATHMAYTDKTLAEIGVENIEDILIVAGGGGGGSHHVKEWDDGSAMGYSNTGGAGGGESGNPGKSDGQGAKGGAGAGPSTGYSFGQAAKSSSGGGGGGGLYGGFAGSTEGGGGGGSGYIGGVGTFTYESENYPSYSKAGDGSAKQTNGIAKITLVKIIDDNADVVVPKTFVRTEVINEYEVPKDGLYKLEVWGAGGGSEGHTDPVSGGYSCGYKEFKKGEILYVVLGGNGSKSRYNGGGTGSSSISSACSLYSNAGGGGATHIARCSGTLVDIGFENIEDILIVAGGGGGSTCYTESWGDGSSLHTGMSGGQGGGESAGSGKGWYAGDAKGGAGATQTAGAAFGQGGNSTGGGGGGGGLYGGFGGTKNNGNQGGAGAGGGGSGYIGGVPQITYNGNVYAPQMITGGGSGGNQNGVAIITFIDSKR